MFIPGYDRESRQLVNKARTLGTGILLINLTDQELLRICAVVAIDLNKKDLVSDIILVQLGEQTFTISRSGEKLDFQESNNVEADDY